MQFQLSVRSCTSYSLENAEMQSATLKESFLRQQEAGAVSWLLLSWFCSNFLIFQVFNISAVRNFIEKCLWVCFQSRSFYIKCYGFCETLLRFFWEGIFLQGISLGFFFLWDDIENVILLSLIEKEGFGRSHNGQKLYLLSNLVSYPVYS